jgi:hypothetical protein
MTEPHRFAKIFPPLTETQLTALADDMKANGLREPITLYEDKVLDGVNREAACAIAGVEPRYETYEGDDPIGFVVSRNVHRRHLNTSQRGIVADDLTTLTHGGNRQEANLLLAITRARAALLMDVSERTVTTAHTITDPDIRDEVKRGKKKLPAAAKEQKARGPKKKGSPKKGPTVDEMRATNTAASRKRRWTQTKRNLPKALSYLKTAIRVFKEDPDGMPGDVDWRVLIEQLSEAMSELKAAIPRPDF